MGVMKAGRCGAMARCHGAGDGAGEGVRVGAAQGGELGDELFEDGLEAGVGGGVGGGERGGLAPGLEDEVDGAVVEVEAAAVGEPVGLRAGHGRTRGAPEVYSPPVARMSSSVRIEGAWPPRAR